MHVGIGDIRKSKGLAKSFDWNDPYKLEGIDIEGPLKLDLKVTNAGSRVMVTGPLIAAVRLPCTRCSEDVVFPLELELEEEYLPAHSEEAMTRAKDLLDGTFTFENDKVVLDELLRQEIEAAFPIQALCTDDCRGLCEKCGANLNRETCQCIPEESDSRWAALKDLTAGTSVPKSPKTKKPKK